MKNFHVMTLKTCFILASPPLPQLLPCRFPSHSQSSICFHLALTPWAWGEVGMVVWAILCTFMCDPVFLSVVEKGGIGT